MLNDFINDELLKSIRLNFSTIILEHSSEFIVPRELTHDYLINNFEIDKSIINYYYLSTYDFCSEDEYNGFVDKGFVGSKKTLLKPYSLIYKGAYIGRKDFYYKLFTLKLSPDIKYKNKSIFKVKDLFPYLDDYALGFKHGYNNFERDCIEKYLTIFADKSDYLNKIYEFVTKHILFSHS